MIITKEIKVDIQKWIKALRSGKYKQTKRTLEDEIGFCCLGVACKKFIPRDLLLVDMFGRITGGYPGSQNYPPEWLKYIDNDFGNRTLATVTLNSEERMMNLSILNDNFNLTFDEIADCLEAVYILEVMSPVTEEVA